MLKKLKTICTADGRDPDDVANREISLESCENKKLDCVMGSSEYICGIIGSSSGTQTAGRLSGSLSLQCSMRIVCQAQVESVNECLLALD